MALVHQTLPPGAYVFVFEKWLHERRSQAGHPFMMYEVRLLGTDFKTQMSWSSVEPYEWRYLCQEWLQMMDAPIGRKFLFYVQRVQVSPADSNSYRNALGPPLCEVVDE